MRGKDLLEAMGYVDEKYVQEADSAGRIVRVKWWRWVSAAACVCLVAAGLLWMLPDRSADCAESDGLEMEMQEETLMETDEIPDQELGALEVPSVILRLDSWTEEGFTGTVTQLVDTEIFAVGQVLNVVLEEQVVFCQDEENLWLDKSEWKQMLDADEVRLLVQFVSYDRETGTIVVNSIEVIQ